jgi:hypothetical protein
MVPLLSHILRHGRRWLALCRRRRVDYLSAKLIDETAFVSRWQINNPMQILRDK